MPAPDRETPPTPRRWRRLLPLGLVVAGSLLYLATRAGKRDGSPPAADELIREVVGSEELILQLAPELGKLSHGLLNLRLPMAGDRDGMFAELVTLRDLADEGEFATAGGGLAQREALAVSAGSQEVRRAELALWLPLLRQVDYFEHAAFKIVDGDYLGGQHEEFEALVSFDGLARATSGAWLGLNAKQLVTWRRSDEGGWRICAWQMKGMLATAGRQRLFSDRLDAALPSGRDRLRARHSIHEEELVKYYRSGKTRARSFDFAPIAMSQKPALSVVDIDGDGFDDLYVMVRMGKNLLLRNRGDGTFEERAAEVELAVEGNSTCGIFADFDNDGDPDLMLGRSLERCQYFENTGAWFQPVEQPVELPALAASMSAADFNGDGLLDLYIATYRPEALGDVSPGFGAGAADRAWPERFLPAEQAAEFRRKHEDTRRGGNGFSFLNQVGPPNVLLVNRGGGTFAPAEGAGIVNVWKNTLQATWADYDGDGDPDLYLANDWAPDHLFRNDRDGGFFDVTAEAGVTAYGFGMGASFGDYDLDGRQDLYVTNMFSKAGRRILARFDGIGADYLKSVDGNVLYRQGADGKFSRVSGLEPPALLVAQAGWSWGGQFADFDNDGDLDIYALSGYFTAPHEVASQVDL